MNYELSIIKRCLEYNSYLDINNLLDVKDLNKETQGLYRALDAFHKEHPGHSLSVADLGNIYQGKDKDFINNVLSTLSTLEVTQESVRTLATNLSKASLLRSLAMQAYEASEGSEKALEDVLNGFKRLSELGSKQDSHDDDFGFFSTDLEELIAEHKKSPGLLWRLDSLNRALGPIRKGNLIIVVARPEVGKTQWILDNGSCMTEQHDGYTLHLSNEEPAEAVIPRYYQSTMGWTREQVFANPKKAKEEFYRRVGEKLLFKDAAHIQAKDVERMCQKYKPKLILVDQLDKIEGFANDREDLRLGSIYRWAREISKEYGPVIGLTQANGDGDNEKWIDMGHVANSKTAKQAEADAIIGLGSIKDTGYEALRFLHLSKNKLPGWEKSDPKMRHGKWEILTRPDIVRFQDL